ncbi:MFS transporter [Corynebacterium sp. S7]
MLSVLRKPTYAKLFSAQIVALLGTGLLTVALGLLAVQIAGSNAGIVMGTAMTIKMIAYVGVSPLMSAISSRFKPKHVLVAADVLRAGVALCLPVVTEAWQIYILIFLLQSASATFTPTFQAVIPAVLPDEDEYTKALSLSRLAYDLESLVSPMIAAALLTVVTYNNLFVGTAVGFIASTLLVLWAKFPDVPHTEEASFTDRLTRGVKAFWAKAELRSLMGLNLTVAATSAMVIANTVVIVQNALGRSESDVALLLAANGAGSMIVALSMPRLLQRITDQTAMLAGGTALPVLLLLVAASLAWLDGSVQWVVLLLLWFIIGMATSGVLTPSSRLLRRNSTEENRSAVFAAQFSLSHACFLVTYPLAGIVGTSIGLSNIAVVLSVLGFLGLGYARRNWKSTESRPAPIGMGQGK